MLMIWFAFNCEMAIFDQIFLILNEEKEMNEVNFSRMVKAYKYIQRELLTIDGDLFLTVDSLITLNNIITNSNNILLRQTNVKPAGYNKQYMHFNQIESELYRLIDQFNDRYISKRYFIKKFLNEIHPFLDGNGRLVKLCLII